MREAARREKERAEKLQAELEAERAGKLRRIYLSETV
jgi:hypothetical protein